MHSKRAFAAIGAGVFLLAAANLMLELVLTRIFSVTMWYHFAFMSISLALLGAAIAGILIFLLPRTFSLERMGRQLTILALCFSVAAVVALVVQLRVHVNPELSLSNIGPLALIYVPTLLPFFFAGMGLSLALTHLTRSVSKLYFLDLFGAGMGCLLVIPILDQVSGPTAVLAVSAVGALSALAFSWQERRTYSLVAVGVVVLALLGLGLNARTNALHIDYAKGAAEAPKLIEKWNHFSRVAVFGDLERPYLWLNIDAVAGTPIPRPVWTDGRVGYDQNDGLVLGYNVAYLAYRLHEGGRTLIIGPGGGLDVVAALALGQDEVTPVEINPAIVEVVNHDLADYTGQLYSLPGVHTVVDEGRSYVASSDERFDIIQISLIDTWAATGAGAFALSENYLYTEEAFVDYLAHLEEDGILSITRWYFPTMPAEMLRLVAVAQSALKQAGVADPSRHIVVAVHDRPDYFGVLLVKRTPFTDRELKKLGRLAPDLQTDVLYAPGDQAQNEFHDLLSAADPAAYYAAYPLNIEPPTDDNPFFFHQLRPRDFARAGSIEQGATTMNLTAVSVLINLLILISILVVLFVLGPLLLTQRRGLAGRSRAVLLLYFACLGLGFMLIEISLMQRLILFLGHPIYSLTVILFTLLVFAGLGSLTTGRIATRHMAWVVLTLVVVLTFYVLALPSVLHAGLHWSKAAKVAVSVGLLAPLGYLMGMPFPLGIKLAGALAPRMVPWLWGINGALSVMASVLSIFMAINVGFTVVALLGQAVYAVAFVAVLGASRAAGT